MCADDTGKRLTPQQEMAGCLGTVAAFVVGVFVLWFLVRGCGVVDEKLATNKYQQQHELAIKKVVGLAEAGVVRKIDLGSGSAYIDPVAWVVADIDQKAEIGAALAYFRGAKSGNNTHVIRLYDHQSGKKLAEWSEWGGLSVAE